MLLKETRIVRMVVLVMNYHYQIYVVKSWLWSWFAQRGQSCVAAERVCTVGKKDHTQAESIVCSAPHSHSAHYSCPIRPPHVNL